MSNVRWLGCLLVAWACLAAGLGGCGRHPGGAGGGEVVLYTSVDDAILRPVVRAFEEESGLRVLIVGDTEATKTTGLVERMIAERARPRADVWWSSEPFGTIRLSGEGLLSAYFSPEEGAFGGAWPARLRGASGDWYGFAPRARVIVYSTARVDGADVPQSEFDLAQGRWAGRIGMARPQFGTTRGHMGFLLASCGPERYRQWLEGLKAASVRLYDGNSAVVRAAAMGEIDAGLTDTDDVYAGKRERWPVEMVYPARGEGRCPPGVMLVPNTVAIVKGGPRPQAAARLLDFLVSERAERMLAQSESRNFPVHPGAADDSRGDVPQGAAIPDLREVAAAIPEALRIWEEVFGR
jgi:iron(III) transport system substrate-binding protein